MMLRLTNNAATSAFLMSADKVKFRRPVRPGDQLMITAKLTKSRAGKLATSSVQCTVDGQVVSSAELMFTLVNEPAEE